MSHVASLELCKELYELSGWDPSNNRIAVQWWDDNNPEWVHVVTGQRTPSNCIPAYDLGYLLRKLNTWDGNTVIKTYPNEYGAFNEHHVTGAMPEIRANASGDTPEDAAAQLCIALIQQGVIKK